MFRHLPSGDIITAGLAPPCPCSPDPVVPLALPGLTETFGARNPGHAAGGRREQGHRRGDRGDDVGYALRAVVHVRLHVNAQGRVEGYGRSRGRVRSSIATDICRLLLRLSARRFSVRLRPSGGRVAPRGGVFLCEDATSPAYFLVGASAFRAPAAKALTTLRQSPMMAEAPRRQS